MKKRKIEIFTLTKQTFIIPASTLPFVAWCAECATKTRMVTPEQAAMVASVNAREIYRRVEAGIVHFRESTEGVLLVCPNSLAVNAGPGADSSIIEDRTKVQVRMK